jgi:hypothetical protein
MAQDILFPENVPNKISDSFFRDEMLFGLDKCFGGTCCLHLQNRDGDFHHESGGSRFFQNVGIFLPDDMVSHARGQ